MAEESVAEMTWEAAQEAFGAPDAQEVFALRAEMVDFRIHLPEAAGPEAVAAGAEVLEATWSLSAAQNRTIWFIQRGGTWQHLLHQDWDKGTEY
ncbi:MAG: hypothetical protein AAGF60_08495 [Pseudomonadota bacterium]